MAVASRQLPGILCCAWLFAQQPPAPLPDSSQGQVVFSVTTSLVQIDAVVTDSKGHYVTDLVANDFELDEDGKPQQITNFSYIRTGSPPAPAGPPRGLKSPATPPPPPAAPVRREDVRRTIVLMVDDLGMSFDSVAFVRHSLRKFVERQIQPGDLVAVCRTAGGSGEMQQFSTDKRILLAAIEALRWNPSVRTGVFEPPDERARSFQNSLSPAVPAVPGQSPPREAAQSTAPPAKPLYDPGQNGSLAVGALGAINYVVRALREMPGRKSVVLFSDGMNLAAGSEIQDALHSLVDRANRAGAVIYTMHTQGLQTLMPNAQDRIDLDGAGKTGMSLDTVTHGAYGVVNGRHDEFNLGQQGLVRIAQQTGGLAYENGNDLNWGLGRVLDDQQGYYLIGYKPDTGTFEARHASRGYHRIAVRVTRPGLHVRSRTGFFGATDDETRPRYDTPIEQMHAAMVSPFQSSGVRLRLTALYAEAPKRGPIVRNLLHIDARDLTFSQTSDGSAVTNMEILAVATGANGQPLAQVAKTFQFHTSMNRLPEDLKQGALYTLDVPIQKAGAYQIHAAVRDSLTGKVGSASQFLEIPDLKKYRVALTGVILQHPGESVTLTTRQFHPGAQLEYFCLVEKGATPHLAAQVRVVRDGRDLYSGAAPLVPIGGGRFAITGKLKLGEKMTSGDYYLGVIAADPAARQHGATVQWAGFEVLPN